MFLFVVRKYSNYCPSSTANVSRIQHVPRNISQFSYPSQVTAHSLLPFRTFSGVFCVVSSVCNFEDCTYHHGWRTAAAGKSCHDDFVFCEKIDFIEYYGDRTTKLFYFLSHYLRSYYLFKNVKRERKPISYNPIIFLLYQYENNIYNACKRFNNSSVLASISASSFSAAVVAVALLFLLAGLLIGA